MAVVGYASAAAGVGLPTSALPRFEFTAPVFTLEAMAGIAVPLFIVTMASQNVPGMTVLAGFGYRAPWSASMPAAGAGTIAASVFGGHAVNLAAISAALAAGEEAGADRGRRWVAAVGSGVVPRPLPRWPRPPEPAFWPRPPVWRSWGRSEMPRPWR